jgi:hypothetical protein
MKGQNSKLLIAKAKYLSFPAVFATSETEVNYPTATAPLFMAEDQSTYTFSATRTQACNNKSQTIAAQIQALQKAGYQPQQ